MTHKTDRFDVERAASRYEEVTGDGDSTLTQLPGGIWHLKGRHGVISARGHREMVNAIDAFLAGWNAGVEAEANCWSAAEEQAASKRKEGVS
jgi:hypothetical protein